MGAGGCIKRSLTNEGSALRRGPLAVSLKGPSGGEIGTDMGIYLRLW